MGESKRRKEAMGEEYGKEKAAVSWLPVSKSQSEKFLRWTTRGAWIGIGALVAWWVVVRFIGPSFGWWEVN